MFFVSAELHIRLPIVQIDSIPTIEANSRGVKAQNPLTYFGREVPVQLII